MSLRETILATKLDELPLRPLLASDRNTPVREALRPRTNRGLGCTVILDEDRRPVGMFNEKLLMRLLRERPDGLNDPVGEHMTRSIVTLPVSATIAELISTMRKRELRWIIVIDESGRAIAITGIRGVMEYMAEQFPHLIKVQNLMCRLAIPREGA